MPLASASPSPSPSVPVKRQRSSYGLMPTWCASEKRSLLFSLLLLAAIPFESLPIAIFWAMLIRL
jgi:hypothetical protein